MDKIRNIGARSSGLQHLPRFRTADRPERSDAALQLRAKRIFRACFEQFRDCVSREKYISKVTLDPLPGKDRRGAWGRKDEEYIADFCLVSKRTLTEMEYRIFRNHFLLGADWKLCCQKLSMDRGNFFHSVYRLQQKLGRVFRELEPYGLFPVDDYFHGPSKSVTSCLTSKVLPIRPPLRNDLRLPDQRTA